MGVKNELCVLVLLATSLTVAMAQNENDFGADDVARQSDLLAIKAVQSATGIEFKNLQDKVDSIDKNQQNLQGKVDSIVKMLEALSAGIDPLVSLSDINLSFQMEP